MDAGRPPAYAADTMTNSFLRAALPCCIGLLVALTLPAVCRAQDRFTQVIEKAEGPVVNAGGYVVNQKRIAVQKELSQRPPTPAELGVKLPANARLNLEQTARQIAQYHPTWRVYDYRLAMPRADFIQFFEAQGLQFNRSRNVMLFPSATPDTGEFIDGLFGDSPEGFRIWRRP
jgi:hypothetical protein